MLEKIKKTLGRKESKVLISNFLSLSLLQGLNIILPFLTIPFVIKKAGLDGFGIISYASAVVLFFIVFVEYGFNTITTRDISIHSENKKEVENIYSEVLTTKLFLALVAFFAFVLLVFSIEKFRESSEIYFLSFGSVLGYVLFPVWLFQGLQEMKYITYVNVFFKSIFTICIFIFLKDRSGLWLVPFFTSLGFITSGIASLIVVRKKFKLNFRFSSVKRIRHQLKGSYPIFVSEIYVALIAYSNILILGFFAGNTVVGVYSAAEKVIRAAGSMISPVVNSLYPYVSKTIYEDFSQGVTFVRKVEKWGKWIIFGLVIILFVTADYLFYLIFGNQNSSSIKDSVLVFRIMIFFPLFSFLDQVYGKLVLIANRKEKLFFKVFSVCSIINLIMCTILSYKFSYIGTAVSVAITQLLIALGMFYYARPILIKSEKR